LLSFRISLCLVFSIVLTDLWTGLPSDCASSTPAFSSPTPSALSYICLTASTGFDINAPADASFGAVQLLQGLTAVFGGGYVTANSALRVPIRPLDRRTDKLEDVGTNMPARLSVNLPSSAVEYFCMYVVAGLRFSSAPRCVFLSNQTGTLNRCSCSVLVLMHVAGVVPSFTLTTITPNRFIYVPSPTITVTGSGLSSGMACYNGATGATSTASYVDPTSVTCAASATGLLVPGWYDVRLWRQCLISTASQPTFVMRTRRTAHDPNAVF
jgi:hypothetical protein